MVKEMAFIAYSVRDVLIHHAKPRYDQPGSFVTNGGRFVWNAVSRW